MAGIGDLVVNLGVATAGFNSGLKTAQGQVRGFTGNVASALSGLAPLLAPVTALYSSLKAVMSVTSEMSKIDATAKLARSVNMTAEKMVGLQHAADLSGVAQESFNLALKRMVRTQPGRTFENIADEISAIRNPTLRAAKAFEIFGKSGQDLLPMFEQDSKALKELIREGAELNGFSMEDALQVEAANDAISRMKTAFIGVARDVAITVAPAVTLVADVIQRIGRESRKAFSIARDYGMGFLKFAEEAPDKVIAIGAAIAAVMLGMRRLNAVGPVIPSVAAAPKSGGGETKPTDATGGGISSALTSSMTMVSKLRASLQSLRGTASETFGAMAGHVTGFSRTFADSMVSIAGKSQTAFAQASGFASAFRRGFTGEIGIFKSDIDTAFRQVGEQSRYWLTRPADYFRATRTSMQADADGLRGRLQSAFSMLGPLVRADVAQAKSAFASLRVVAQAASVPVAAIISSAFSRAFAVTRTGAAVAGRGIMATFAAIRAGAVSTGSAIAGGFSRGFGAASSLLGSAAIAAASFGGQFAGIASQMLTFLPVVSAIGPVLAGLFTPVGLVVTAVGAGIAVFVNRAGGMAAAFELVKAKASAFWSFMQPVWIQLKTLATTVFNGIAEVGSFAFEQLSSIVGSVFSAIGGNTTLTFTGVRDAIVTALVGVEFGFLNAGRIAESAWMQIKLGAVVTGSTIRQMFTNAGELLAWFGSNWKDTFFTAFDLASTVFINLGTNIRNAMSSIWEFIKSGGTKSLALAWTPLTDGFVNTIKKIPELSSREISPLEMQIRSDLEKLNGDLGSEFDSMLKNRKDEIASTLGAVPDVASAMPDQLKLGLSDDAASMIQTGIEIKTPGLLKDSAEAFSAIYAAQRRAEGIGNTGAGLTQQITQQAAAPKTAIGAIKAQTVAQSGAASGSPLSSGQSEVASGLREHAKAIAAATRELQGQTILLSKMEQHLKDGVIESFK